MQLIPLVILGFPAFRQVVFLSGKNEVFGWFWCHSDRVTVLLLKFGNIYSPAHNKYPQDQWFAKPTKVKPKKLFLVSY